MNKKEVADYLGISTRLVERYAGEGRLGNVRYVRGRTGKQAEYAREAVDHLKAELESVDRPLPAHSPATGLVGAQDRERFITALEAIAQSREQTRAGLDGAPSVSIVDLAHKLTLALDEAAQLSGLSRNHLRDAIKGGKLKAKILGRGWRVKRADLDAYVKKL